MFPLGGSSWPVCKGPAWLGLAARITHLAWCLQVYLIEVNTSPALVRHGEVLKDLLPRVIEEVVQKVGPALRVTLRVAAISNELTFSLAW